MAKTTKSTLKPYTTSYSPNGVAYKTTTKEGATMIILKLQDGTTMILKKATSAKQLKYYQYKTTKNYTSKKDIMDIYNSSYIIDKVITNINEDILPQHANEKNTTKEPTAREKLIQQEETQKAADEKTHQAINKALAKQKGGE